MAVKVKTVEESTECPIKVSVGELTIPNAVAPPAEKPKRKKKQAPEVINAEPNPQQSYLTSDMPYHTSYQETDNIFRDSIMQLDLITAQAQEDLNTIRGSKTIRNKYSYISDITGSMVSAISGKISAARELNKSIKDSHELDLKRMKELKLNEEKKDDEKAIMDIYKAFISQPVSQNLGAFQSPLGASTLDLTLGAVNGTPNPMGINMLGQDPNYNAPMTQEQMIMMVEENPDMKHVIAYDQMTGNAEFAIFDQRTGQFLQGLPTRNKEMYMNSMNFDFNNMRAHSDDLNESYDIIFTNSSNGIQQPIPKNKDDMSDY